MTSKVVKLEEVEQRRTETSFVKKVLQDQESSTNPSKENDYKEDNEALQKIRLQCDSVSNFTEEELVENKDTVYPLPENWPKIAALKERPFSCELTTCRTPCVEKAVAHLKAIQTVVDDWFKRALSENKSTTSSRNSSAKASTKKQLRFQDVDSHSSSTDYYKERSESHVSSSRLSSAYTDISVDGRGTHILEDKQKEEHENVPQLGSQEVIDEVIKLLARLESERLDLYERYLKEIEIGSQLKRRIDDLAMRKLVELPALVQREHEACIVDLNELHWHVNHTSRDQAKVQNRFTFSERLNNQLKEDINFVQQHVPLVQEKLVLEVEAMDKIKKAQGETDQELVMTRQRQTKTEMKSSEANNKADTERSHIKKELDTVRENLTSISDELSEAKMTHNSYVHQVNDIYKQLGENEMETSILTVKCETIKVAEDMQTTKVRNLQSKLTDAEFELRQLRSQNGQLEQELHLNKSKHNHRINDLDRQTKSLENQLRKLTRKNQEINMEAEDLQEKLKKCDKQKISDDKNMDRINREIERTTAILEQTLEEHARVSIVNLGLHTQLHDEEDRAFRTEEKLKIQTESLKKQVKEEIHTRTVLQARIVADKAEMDKVKADSAKKNGKAQGLANDVERAVSVVLEKVEKLRSAKAERDKQKSEAESELSDTKIKHEETTRTFTEQLKELQPKHDTLKFELGSLTKKLGDMKEHSDKMNNKVEEMDGAQVMMERSVDKSQAAIIVLEAELTELNLQLDAARRLHEDLKKEYNDTVDRIRQTNKKQAEFLKDRQDVFSSTELEKQRFMETNHNLASRYRQLQNDYIVRKEEMLKAYEGRIKVEATITDVKQLKSLQTKMHGALSEYFKLSGLYNEAELNKLEQESGLNGVKATELQVDMEKALDDIQEFFSLQIGGVPTRTNQQAGNNKKTMLFTPHPPSCFKQETVVN